MLPEPLTLTSAVDRETSEESRRDIGIPRKLPDHTWRKVREPHRVRRERVVATDRVGVFWMREHPTDARATVLILSRLLFQEPIERLIAAIKSPSVVR